MAQLVAMPKKALETKVWIILWPSTVTDHDKTILKEVEENIVIARDQVVKAAGKFTQESAVRKTLETTEETLGNLIASRIAPDSYHLGVNDNGRLFLASNVDIRDSRCKSRIIRRQCACTCQYDKYVIMKFY